MGTISRGEMEERRLHGVEMLRNGASQSEVARVCGVSRTSAFRWDRDYKAGRDLKRRKPPGRPCRLSGEQLRALYGLWETQPRWTTATFAGAIRVATGIAYDPDHVGRLILRLGLRAKRVKAPLSDVRGSVGGVGAQEQFMGMDQVSHG